MATIRDVSKEAGLSIATVSRALSHPDKVSKQSLKKVQQAIDKLQYQPNMLAQKFRHKRANVIVVLVPNIANLFFAKVISGIEEVAQKRGYSVLLGETRDSTQREQDYIHLVETRQADGVLQLRPHHPDALLPRNNVLAVNAGGCVNTPYLSVRIDNQKASRRVIDYLLELGHKRIGIISGKHDNPHTINRLAGVQQALQNAGLPFDPNMVAEGDFSLWSGMNAVQHFITMQPRPTALFCMNDEMAIGAIKGLKENGLRVPEDMSVTGFDNLEVSNYCDPPLTTIAQPSKQLGEQGAALLFQLIDDNAPTQQEFILPHEFIIRQSTTVAPSSQ